MTIEYITDVIQKGRTTFVVSTNGKSVNVEYTEKKKSIHSEHIHQERYVYKGVTVYGDMTISSSSAHLAEIVLAVEIVRVIKENK